MKIQCNVCEAAEAVVLCCADEAALCLNCDQKVHAANKLASKHQRVPLSCSSSDMPMCDICQETAGYFFCLEDRALLCRKCDVAIHTANSLVSVHRRFLLTGVKVGLEANEAHPASSSGKINPNTAEKILELELHSPSKRTNPVSSTSQYGKTGPIQASVCGDVPLSKLPSTGGISNGSVPLWQFDEFMGLSDFTQNYNFMSNCSSKVLIMRCRNFYILFVMVMLSIHVNHSCFITDLDFNSSPRPTHPYEFFHTRYKLKKCHSEIVTVYSLHRFLSQMY
ncbi:hypothetical protein ACS0TY_016768 [Phlomoides rotata]